jgi:single-stranded-DNA-specific exonuclease
MTTATSIELPRRGLLHRWTGPALAVGPGSWFERVLAARGWTDRRDTWFAPGLRFDELEAPYLRSDFLAAADVILAGLADGKRLAIYGDYDADGLTATAILYHAIRALEPGLEPRCYIPHRRQEGYGLHLDALRSLRAEGIELVVTVDCGIVAVEEVAAARAEGMTVVVTDHHAVRADGRIPEADAVVHPSLPGREHRWPECCGAMLAWKLAWTLFVRREGSPDRHALPERLKRERARLSALAAVGTVADVMPLVGENRELVRFGLANSKRTGVEGLDALWRFGDIAGAGITSEAIAFRLAPRLNAAGRLGSAEAALRLLTVETDPRRCAALVRELDAMNTARKELEAKAVAEATGRIDPDSAAIVLSDPGWNSGLVGIVCSRLLERHGRPVLLFEEFDDGGVRIAKGSGRAPPGFPLLEAMEAAIAVAGIRPRKRGGHAAAAGMTLELEDVPAFRAAFEAETRQRRANAGSGSELAVDLEFPREADPAWISREAVGELERIGPFGRGNPRPTMVLRGARFPSPAKLIGGKGSHLAIRIRLGDAERSDAFFEARWWNAAAHAPALAGGGRHDVVVAPRLDRYLGEVKILFEILDAAASG